VESNLLESSNVNDESQEVVKSLLRMEKNHEEYAAMKILMKDSKGKPAGMWLGPTWLQRKEGHSGPHLCTELSGIELKTHPIKEGTTNCP
jgi:hypothetical protein